MNNTRPSINPFRMLPVVFALVFNAIAPVASIAVPATSPIGMSAPQVAVAADAPVITQDTDANGCNGVVTTPGSENTDKRFISGSLEPGGTATFEISYPVDPEDVSGREQFEITDCVFIGGDAVAKYFIHFVPNTENFLLTFTLNVPSNAPIGSEYCNYAKTTAAPSQSQASNRKAGPACFIVGGALRVLKVDGENNPLPGADFDIACDYPTSTAALATTVISAPDDGSVSDGKDANTTNDAHESFNSTSGGTLSASATTGSDGAIDVQAPVGTVCTFTETAAPSGYLLPDANDVTLTVVTGKQQSHKFVNELEAPALEISKTADDATVNAGEQIGFTIDVESTGNSAVKGAALSDPLPGGTGINWSVSPAYSGPGTCSITGTAPQTLGCSFGDLAAGASASVHVVSDTTAGSCKTYENTATADGSNIDPVSDDAKTTVECPDLDLDKTPDGGSVDAGDNISFTLTVTNNGDGTAQNVDIDDLLPAGFSWSESPDKTECSITSGALHCDIASLASGASFSVTVSAATDAADCKQVTNHATADADNNTEVTNDGDVTIHCADVAIEKLGNGPINAGETATFTITVTASGDRPSTNVEVNDDLPAGITWSLGTANDEEQGGCAIDPSADPDALTCSFDSIASGTSKVIVLNGTADQGSCPSIYNEATVSSDFDTDTENNSDSATVAVNCGDIDIDKTPDDGTVNAGGTATFTFVVTNKGDGAATGVTVSDQLPDVSGSWTDDSDDCSVDGSDLLTCSLGSMAADASLTIHVSTTVGLSDCGVLDNPHAYANTANDGSDDDAGKITVTCPSLTIEKTTSTPVVTAGDVAHYTITVSNAQGTGMAEDVTVSDALPSGLTWTEASDDCSISGSALSCGPVDIAAGSSFSVTLTGTTDAGDCPSISNTASFASGNAGSDSSDSNDRGPTVITVNCPDVSVEKTAHDPEVNAGDQVGYDITVTAGGTGDSTNVTLTDTVPAGITWSVGGADASACDIASGVLSCDFGTMAPGTSKSITLTGTAGPEDCGTLANTAEVSSDVDVNGQNDSFGPVEIKVNCPDVSVQKTGSGTVSAGDAIHYTIAASNSGGGDAYGFVMTDTLPAASGGWTLAQDAPEFCQLSGNSLTCALAVFEAGDSFSVTLNAKSSNADCGELDNTAHVSATNERDSSAGEDNQSSWTITVNCPNLTITKSADNGTISAGDDAKYTITVTNDGPGTAYDVHLDENLPDGLSWAIDSVDPSEAGTCASSMSTDEPQSITCDFDSLADGDSVTIHLSAETATADCGTLHNVATVSGSNEDPAQLTDNEDSADIVVECPGLNVAKDAVDDSIVGGDTAAFSMVVWNAGPGTAHNVTLSDNLPGGLTWTENSEGCSIANGVLSCSFGDLGVSSFENSTARVTVSAGTTRDACGTLDNLAVASADNDENVDDDATIAVHCPTVAIEKTNDQTASVLPGTVVTYSLQVTVADGPAASVQAVDTLPQGLDDPTNISNSGAWNATTRTISWNLGDLASGEHSLSYQAAVSSDATNGQTLKNVVVVTSSNSQCPDAETLGPECTDDSTVTTRVPTLVIDKAASTESVHFHFDANGNVLSVTPADVTWTLTWTLANGPVTNSVISDPLPEFIDYVAGSASNGGTYDATTRTLTWSLGILSASSGSMTFKTTVDPDAPETGPIENVATIDSAETAPDQGVDSIRITSDSEQASTGTPKPSLPNTALGSSTPAQPLNIPVWVLLLVLVGSLGSLTGLGVANLVAVRRRR